MELYVFNHHFHFFKKKVACADANRTEVEKIIANDPNIRKTILEKNNQGLVWKTTLNTRFLL